MRRHIKHVSYYLQSTTEIYADPDTEEDPNEQHQPTNHINSDMFDLQAAHSSSVVGLISSDFRFLTPEFDLCSR
ncbi:hypothetical protein INT45_005480 [Circinella minor]|uniref:Uncharacterized protein n=1 Tax=Circinella minor TaxID=1195481 RepID=A0A8H7RVE6_9FUNG|nr:hypothetical protein INT45_005480 [Circinella minor]